ncbi:MAG: tRNA lysidine(34) synthetase TilS, partial [Spirochaetales bacterium]|nr:tRNA lysidine(34) synthetase TilS [Spirochaetales bacterium]
LLFADKAMLLQYAQTEKLAWREDESNTQNSYSRNLIRNKVMPLLKTINPNLEATGRLTMERLGQVEAVFNEHLAAIRKQILHQRGGNYYIAIQAVRDKTWAPVVVWGLLKPFGFNFLQLKGLLSHNSQSGKMLYSPSYQLYVDRSEWIITPRTRSSQTIHTITTSSTKTLETQDYRLQMTVIPRAQYTLIPDSRVAALDLARLTFPLTIRKWQPGDFFYPLGMQARKKLSDFLVDLKVPMPLKERVYVVVAGGEIVWVIGYRIDDRFKITDTTRAVYEAQLTPLELS